VDAFGDAIFEEKTMQETAQAWMPTPVTIEQTMDRLLLTLWDALFPAQSEHW